MLNEKDFRYLFLKATFPAFVKELGWPYLQIRSLSKAQPLENNSVL